MMADLNALPTTLIDLLSNSLVLRQIAPYIPIKSLLQLASTSHQFRNLLYSRPEAWQYLDLTRVKRAIIKDGPIDVGGFAWRAERMDESLTEDDFYAGPLRGILASLHRKNVLGNVYTLVLDGLSVPADLVREIVCEDRYSVKILSLREAKNLNQAKLQQVLRYIVRPTRADSTPKLRALYFFGPKDAPRILSARPDQHPPSAVLGVMSSQGAQIGAEWNQKSSNSLALHLSDEQARWYSSTGQALRRPVTGWPETIQACKGIIHFDAVLCRGPRHDITKVDSKDFLQPTIATVALGPNGCEMCEGCPEEPAIFGHTEDYHAFPVLGPVPFHSSTLRASQRPSLSRYGKSPRLLLRCEDCLRGRWCEQCNRWWCEACYEEPTSRAHRHAEMQQAHQLSADLQREGWTTLNRAPNIKVKVFSKLCVEHCLVGEMMSGAGSNGMWG